MRAEKIIFVYILWFHVFLLYCVLYQSEANGAQYKNAQALAYTSTVPNMYLIWTEYTDIIYWQQWWKHVAHLPFTPFVDYIFTTISFDCEHKITELFEAIKDKSHLLIVHSLFWLPVNINKYCIVPLERKPNKTTLFKTFHSQNGWHINCSV